MKTTHYGGLIAATFTPMHPDGRLNLAPVGRIVDRLVGEGIRGLYVCGSTGEGPSLTVAERKAVLEAHVEASAGRIPVIAQVGHDSLAEAADLARHAASAGADAISAVPPCYFKPGSTRVLAECIEQVAGAAPALPFYYYHIPRLSGMETDVVALVGQIRERVPAFAGVKYSAPSLDELLTLTMVDGPPLNLLFGIDESLLSGLVAGAHGAVGTTYNYMTPLFRHVLDALDRGDLPAAMAAQGRATRLIRAILRYGAQPALKAVMAMIGEDCGPSRLPLRTLSPKERESLRSDLERLGFLPRAGGPA